MVLTRSTMMELGSPAPGFSLPEVGGGTISRDDFSGKPALLVMFLSRHCPYVKHVEAGLTALCAEYAERGVSIVAISSNDAEKYPDDRPDSLREQKKSCGFTFPYLFDESQGVARAYRAACTPDFFLFDSQQRLIYRGQMDDSRPENGRPVTGADLRAALDAALSGAAPASDQTPSMGCSIKWKPGNEPDYFG